MSESNLEIGCLVPKLLPNKRSHDLFFKTRQHARRVDLTGPTTFNTNSHKIMSGEDDSSGWQLTESDPGVFTYVVLIF